MIVATCDCGGEAPFIIEEERKGPIYTECEECGQEITLQRDNHRGLFVACDCESEHIKVASRLPEGWR